MKATNSLSLSLYLSLSRLHTHTHMKLTGKEGHAGNKLSGYVMHSKQNRKKGGKW